jgi:hypothetical protein
MRSRLTEPKVRLMLSGPAVTLFGGRESLDHAISQELGRRGCSVHHMSVPLGWLSSATYVIARLSEVCRLCSDHHSVSLLWHVAIAAPPTSADLAGPDALAATIVDEIEQHPWLGESPYVTRTIS